MRILHILTDWIICDYVPSLMDKCVGEHYYVRFVSPSDLKVKTKHLHDKRIRTVVCPSDEYLALANDDSFDYVWQHGLYNGQEYFILRNSSSRKVIWSTWGFDYVRFGVQWLYGFQTSIRLFKYFPVHVVLKKAFMWALMRMHLIPLIPHSLIRFLKRVDYYSTVLDSESDMMQRLLQPNAKRIDFTYIKGEQMVKRYPKVNMGSRHILLGNSSDITNNHFDVFPFLKFFKDYEIWAPLSYDIGGVGMSKYQQDVLKRGQEEFGERFHPLVTFLPYPEYVKLIQKCSICIFGHHRQKALGNVDIALKRGALVFMSHRSPVFRFYKEKGIFIYSLKELKERGLGNVLTEFKKHRKENMSRYESLRGHNVLLKEVQESLRFLQNECLK